MQLRIGIVGAGAIGCAIAANIADAGGNTVSMLARGETLLALQKHGVRRHENITRSIDVRSSDNPGSLGEQDILFLSTKAHALTDLAPSLVPMIGPRTTVIPLINGVPWWFFACSDDRLPELHLKTVDPNRVLSSIFPARQVVGAVVNMSCYSPLPGVVHRESGNRLTLGAVSQVDGQVDAVERARQLLTYAGFDTVVSENIRQIVWYKLWGNSSFSPISALTRATGDRIAADPATRALCVQMMNEAAEVSKAFGLFIKETPENRIAVTEKLGSFKTSMLQDVEARRPLEQAALIGSIVEIADYFSVSIPTIRTVDTLLCLLNKTIIKDYRRVQT